MKKLKILAAMIGIMLLFAGALSGCAKNEGIFYTLQEAYDAGMLTQNDLMSIAYYHNGGRKYNEDIMSEDYTPIPKMPQELGQNVSYKIRATVALELRRSKIKEAKTDGVSIVHYYGTYDGAVAVIVTHSYLGDSPAVTVDISYSVAGVIFHYWTYNLIQIWIND